MISVGNKTYSEHGESIFSIITELANEHEAVNLGQGFPNLSPPRGLLEQFPTQTEQPLDHQYAPSPGRDDLRSELANLYRKLYGLTPDPDREITITSGATEALQSAFQGLLNPGDHVVLLEPTYDLYPPVCRRAGANLSTVCLEEPDFSLPTEKLVSRLDDSVDLLVLNNPHNPTGQVFNSTELTRVVRACESHGITIIADEVYEHLVLDGDYKPLWTIEGARERTLFTGSVGKAFNATGWKIGWAIGPPELTQALRRAHQFTTFCAPNPLQKAVADFVSENPVTEWWETEFRPNYQARRDHLLEGLNRSPFEPVPSRGTYFQLARIPDSWQPELETDLEVARHLIREHKLASIPVSSFYLDSSNRPDHRYLRFAFCKTKHELDRAVHQLEKLG